MPRHPTIFALAAVLVANFALTGCRHAEHDRTRDKTSPRRAAAPVSPDAPPATRAAASKANERAADGIILEWLGTHSQATADQIDDALPNERLRLTALRDPGSPVWTKLLVDLDRDGKIDEKWFLAAGGPGKKKVSTNDDGHFDREERWRDGRWVRKRGQW